MKTEDVLRAIEGQPNLIAEAAKEKKEFFSRTKCVSCGSSVVPEVTVDDLTRMLPDQILPFGKARCTACRCLFDPFTRLIIERGSIVNAIEPAVSIIDTDG